MRHPLFSEVGGLFAHNKDLIKAYLRKYSPLAPSPYPPKGPYDHCEDHDHGGHGDGHGSHEPALGGS